MNKGSPLPTPPPVAGDEHPPPFSPAAEQLSMKAPEGSLKDIQNQMVIYSNTLYDTTTSNLNPFNDPSLTHLQQQPLIQLPEQSPENLTLAAENVARALEDLANAHPSPQAQSEYRRKAKKFRKLSQLPKEKQHGALYELGRGFMLLLLAPVALAGMVLYVTGVMLEGTGAILKSVGYHSKKLFRVDRRREWPLRDASAASV